jgi:hypothetical protein
MIVKGLGPAEAPPEEAATSSLEDHLGKLASLFERGLLTSEEFKKQQRFLLNIPVRHVPIEAAEDADGTPTDDALRMRAAMEKAIAQRVDSSKQNVAPSFGKRDATRAPKSQAAGAFDALLRSASGSN